MTMREPESNYIAFLELEFSGAAPTSDDVAGRPSPGPQDRELDWAGLHAAIAPRSRLGPIFGVTQGDIDRAWQRLSRHPDLLVPRQRIGKRVLDVTVAGLVLALFMPALIVAIVAIKMESRGPAVFRQSRIGAGGRAFTMYKLRTMQPNADTTLASLADGAGADGVLFKMRTDPRITRVGRILRRYSIDELPQLINVLRGDMSLVGPRPALPAEVVQYDNITRRRLLEKPGLTGLWQVSGRKDLTWEEAVRLDLHYVDNSGLTLDLLILFRTVATILSGRGAY